MSLWADLAGRFGTRRLVRLMNLYPPYIGAGIRVRASDDLTIVSELSLRAWNRNFIGAHFGGSIYAMCDPFYALILAGKLGADYMVLDKSATVHFRRLGKSTLSARFAITQSEVDDIQRIVDDRGRHEPRFTADVLDDGGQLVAQVEKTVYVRKKRGASWERQYA